MIKLIKRISDRKYLDSADNDTWVDSIDTASEMSFSECETAKVALLKKYSKADFMEIVNFNKNKSISNEEKKVLLDILKNDE